MDELRSSLESTRPGSKDWITFVGYGEPTLNRDLGALIRGTKALSDIPIAVITNGYLLGEPEVADALRLADAVMPTLDAASPDLFRRINRPPAKFSVENHIRGLSAFRRIYKGRLWVEVMLLDGLNDSEDALVDLADAMESIGPDAVHILLPTRPPAEATVLPSNTDGLVRARRILENKVHVLMPDERRGGFTCESGANALDAIADILVRHPMAEKELELALHEAGILDATSAIENLVESGRAVKVERYDGFFYRGGPN